MAKGERMMGSEVVADTPNPGRPRRRAWWRRGLSLRALMAVVLVVGCGLGFLANRVATRARAIAAIRDLGGFVTFRDEPGMPKGGAWSRLYGRTGVEFCREVGQVSYVADSIAATVRLPRPAGSDVARFVAAAAQLPETEYVTLAACPVAASDLAPLAGWAGGHLMLRQLRGWTDDQGGTPVPLAGVKALSLGMKGQAELPRSALALIGRMPALEKLYLESPLPSLRGDDLAPLAQLEHLALLDLNRTPIDESALGPLAEMTQLRAIWMPRARVGDATLGRIARGHHDLASIEVDGSDLTDAGVATLAQLPRLAMVALRGAPGRPGHLTDASLISLGKVLTLRRLVVTCGRFGPAGVDGLRDLNLVRLALRSVEGRAASSLAVLVRQQILEWLRLGGPGVTDRLLPHLAQNLVPRRAILDLSDSAITDAGLAHLAPLPVAELVLDRTAVTDAGLAALPTLLGPRRISLRDTKATPAGIAAFDRAHPGKRQTDDFLDED